MRKQIGYGVMVAALSAALVMPVFAQGRGRGFGAGMGPRAGGYGIGAGLGRQAGRGPGGWWTRVTPTTPEQQAFIAQVTDIHNQIRTLNFEIASLRANKGSAADIAAKEQKIAELRAELSRITTANEKLIRDMGIPAPYGVCTGQGPAGRFGGQGAPGMGRAGWRGNGLGLRDGSGPNPYCPLKK